MPRRHLFLRRASSAKHRRASKRLDARLGAAWHWRCEAPSPKCGPCRSRMALVSRSSLSGSRNRQSRKTDRSVSTRGAWIGPLPARRDRAMRETADTEVEIGPPPAKRAGHPDERRIAEDSSHHHQHEGIVARVEYTEARLNVRLPRAHSKARTPARKTAKAMKRSKGSLRHTRRRFVSGAAIVVSDRSISGGMPGRPTRQFTEVKRSTRRRLCWISSATINLRYLRSAIAKSSVGL